MSGTVSQRAPIREPCRIESAAFQPCLDSAQLLGREPISGL